MRYFVNKNQQTTGEHEVHTSECGFLPAPENRIYLGEFTACEDAVREARKHYDNVDGCYHCCRECHKR